MPSPEESSRTAEAEAAAEAVEAEQDIQDAAEEAADEVIEEAHEAEQTAEEGLDQAVEAAESVEEAVEEAVEDAAESIEHPHLTEQQVREIVQHEAHAILRERGVELTTSQSDSPAEVAVDAAENALQEGEAVVEEVVPAPEPLPTEPARDIIAPENGHWYYRRRAFWPFGR